MGGILGCPAPALAGRSSKWRRRCCVGLLEQCRDNRPRSPGRRPRGTKSPAGEIPGVAEGFLCNPGSPGQA
eukprot:4797203-Amphidinium_carterae.1